MQIPLRDPVHEIRGLVSWFNEMKSELHLNDYLTD